MTRIGKEPGVGGPQFEGKQGKIGKELKHLSDTTNNVALGNAAFNSEGKEVNSLVKRVTKGTPHPHH
jgi:hypothetical protein